MSVSMRRSEVRFDGNRKLASWTGRPIVRTIGIVRARTRSDCRTSSTTSVASYTRTDGRRKVESVRGASERNARRTPQSCVIVRSPLKSIRTGSQYARKRHCSRRPKTRAKDTLRRIFTWADHSHSQIMRGNWCTSGPKGTDALSDIRPPRSSMTPVSIGACEICAWPSCIELSRQPSQQMAHALSRNQYRPASRACPLMLATTMIARHASISAF
jgi:hypothetical protein